MEDLFDKFRNHIRNLHERENKADEFGDRFNQEVLDWLVDHDVKIAKEYHKVHGVIVNHLNMRLWWALNRKPHDFALTDSDKQWLDEVVEKMTDEEIEDFAFPEQAPNDRLLYLITCLKDTNSVKGIDLSEDAYDYMRDNCPLFDKRSNELSDRDLANRNPL